MSDTTFLSLGLDIGTTTTHLVISRLTLGPGEDPFGKHHVFDKRIVHRGRVHMTPFTATDTIDADAIADLVRSEYAGANVTPEEIPCGAVIVTGETALKANAQQIVQRIAGESSAFAAAVAGANTEAVLAGRGSGAADHAGRHRCRTLSIDIGGGTANLAWFENNTLLDAAAIRVGGRHLVRDTNAPRWRVMTETARSFLGTTSVDDTRVADWIEACSNWCAHAIRNRFDQIPESVVITRPHHDLEPPDVVFFTGGVGELMARLELGREIDEDYGDTGALLARALFDHPHPPRSRRMYPADPIRATVIGAGQFAVSISGDTLWLTGERLPLRNLPLLKPWRYLCDIESPESIAMAIDKHRRLKDLDATDVVAIVLPNLMAVDWQRVEQLGRWLASAAQAATLARPWVFVMKDNLGKSLGRAIQNASQPPGDTLVIDEVHAVDADYIDIGQPLEKDPPVMPIVLKTLVFQ